MLIFWLDTGNQTRYTITSLSILERAICCCISEIGTDRTTPHVPTSVLMERSRPCVQCMLNFDYNWAIISKFGTQKIVNEDIPARKNN